jgi:acetyl esterase/lipase
MRKTTAILILLVTLPGCTSRTANRLSQKIDDLMLLVPAEEVAHYQREVVWLNAGGVEVKADVSWPEGDGPFPMLVWIHGGGWSMFSKEGNVGLARYITNRGYVVFNVDYRMAPDVPMKIIIEDALGAVIWAKDRAAQYNGDPSRVAVAGHSAGGHLAAMVTVAAIDPYFTPSYQSKEGNDAAVDIGIPVSGIFDFISRATDEERSEFAEKIFGASYESDPELFEKCSPISYVRADLPPQLVVYAEKEGLRVAAEEWVTILEEKGATVESYMEPGQNHPWPSYHWKEPAQNTFNRMIEFMDQHLK